MARYIQCPKTHKLIPADQFYDTEPVKTHFVIGEIPEYHSPIDGSLIDSRKKRNQDLQRSGSRPWEGIEQENKEAERRRANIQRQEESRAFKAAERAFMQLPENVRRQLAGGNLDY